MADRKVKYEIDVEAKSDTVRRAKKDHEDFGKTAHGMIGILERLTKQSVLSAEGFRTMGIAAQESRAHVGEFLEFVGAEAALEVLEKIAEKIIDIGKEAIHSAADAQRMNRAIDIVSGGREKGEENRSWLERFASGGGGHGYTGTEFSEAQSEKAFLNLKRIGESDQNARLAMKAAADLASIAAPDEKDQQFQGAVDAFTRFRSQGRVQMRQLMSLGLGIEDFKTLDQFKGKSDKSIRTAMEQGTGKIGENDFYKLIMNRVGEKEIGKRAAENADLLGTKLAKLEELPERFFKKLADTTAVTKLGKAIDGVLQKFSPDSPDGAKIFDAIENLTGKFADAIGSINLDDLADSIKDDVIPAVEGLVDLIKPMVELFERMFRGAHKLHDLVLGPSALHDEDTPIAKQAAEFRAQVYEHQVNKKHDATITGKETGAKVSVHGGKMHFEKSAEDAFGAGQAGAEGLAAGFEDKGDDAVEAAGDTADKMVKEVKKRHKIHSPSEVFGDIAEMDVAGYVQAMHRMKDDAGDASGIAFRPPAARGGGDGGTMLGGVTIGDINIYVDGAAAQDPAQLAGMIRDAFDKNLDTLMARWLGRMRAGSGA